MILQLADLLLQVRQFLADLLSVAARSRALPLDAVLALLLYEADTLEDVCDVVDAPFLTYLQKIRGLRKTCGT